ncbi:MAG: phage portal protein, partial [Pirellulaceae bacterium]|nr:phage portal protein [Pirellulaceae bacterium]
MQTDRAKMQAFLVAKGQPATGTTAAIAERATQFDYNAATDKGRRQAPQTRTKQEDIVLSPPKRAKLNSTAQDQIRNHSLPAWMVRTHLDYVSSFKLSIRTESDELNDVLMALFKWHGRPENFDIAERLGREESFRLFEREKLVSGDAGFIKINGERKLQGLESDLIAKHSPNQEQSKAMTAAEKEGIKQVNDQGLVQEPTGKRLAFSVCARTGVRGAVEFDHLEPAENVIFDGYWTRLTSQRRGISPLSTALNTVQDIFEANEWNLLKAKLHAIFGVAILRKSGAEGGDMGGAGGATDETEDADATATGTSYDLNPSKPSILDLDEGADVKILESSTPSTEFVQGQHLFMQLAMLAIDLPATFLDSRKSSFSAMLADQNKYETAARDKQKKNRYVRQAYSDWLIELVWADENPDTNWNLKNIATKAGASLMQVKAAINWILSGTPWIDRLKEAKGSRLVVESLL